MTIKDLRRHAGEQVEDYLLAFPEEKVALRQLLAQLREDTGDVFDRKNMRGHITTSALAYDFAADAVLVIHHGQYDSWLPPGGHQEGADALSVSAAREADEETAAVVTLHSWHHGSDIPFDIDTHAIAAVAKKQEGDHFHHDFIYLFAADSTLPLKPQLSEVKAAKWISRSEFAQLPGARVARLSAKLSEMRQHAPRQQGRNLRP